MKKKHALFRFPYVRERKVDVVCGEVARETGRSRKEKGRVQNFLSRVQTKIDESEIDDETWTSGCLLMHFVFTRRQFECR